jgi:hypothetical protein
MYSNEYRKGNPMENLTIGDRVKFAAITGPGFKVSTLAGVLESINPEPPTAIPARLVLAAVRLDSGARSFQPLSNLWKATAPRLCEHCLQWSEGIMVDCVVCGDLACMKCATDCAFRETEAA